MAAAALSPQNLRYPQWQGEYQAVLLELDNQKLLERIAAAETAILVRVQAFAKWPMARRERQAIDDSLRCLRVLKNNAWLCWMLTRVPGGDPTAKKSPAVCYQPPTPARRSVASFKDGGARMLGCLARRQLADALHGGHYRTANPAGDRELPLQSPPCVQWAAGGLTLQQQKRIADTKVEILLYSCQPDFFKAVLIGVVMLIGWIRLRLFNIAQEVLVVKNDVEKWTMDFNLTVVANEAQLPEPVHEKANPWVELCPPSLQGFLDWFWELQLRAFRPYRSEPAREEHEQVVSRWNWKAGQPNPLRIGCSLSANMPRTYRKKRALGEALPSWTSYRFASQMLKTLTQAVDRIQHGNFGECTESGGDIEPKRLQAIPWARYCVKCQEAREQGWCLLIPLAAVLFALSHQFRFPEGEPRQRADAQQDNADSR
jgi:Prokaryotic dksA/traR C4-type zinc finger